MDLKKIERRIKSDDERYKNKLSNKESHTRPRDRLENKFRECAARPDSFGPLYEVRVSA